jgi:hypothetical protein
MTTTAAATKRPEASGVDPTVAPGLCLRALIARAHDPAELATRLGWDMADVVALAHSADDEAGHPTLTADEVAAVHAVYNALATAEGSSRAWRSYARSQRWNRADQRRDRDTNAQHRTPTTPTPSHRLAITQASDELMVDMAVSGDRASSPSKLSNEDRDVVVNRLLHSRLSSPEIARRAGVNVRKVQRLRAEQRQQRASS